MALLCNVSCSGDGLVGQSAALFGWWLRRGNLSKPWWPLTVSTHGLLLHRFWETGFLLQGRWETEQSVSRVQISAHFIGGVGGTGCMYLPACWSQLISVAGHRWCGSVVFLASCLYLYVHMRGAVLGSAGHCAHVDIHFVHIHAWTCVLGMF